MTPWGYLRRALVGTDRALSAHRRWLAQGAGIATGSAELERLAPGDPATDGEEPIFLFSAGWRSGSTLLQRLVMSDTRVMVWGEPYDECGPLQALSGTVSAFRPDWPPPEYYHDGRRPECLSEDWVANLFPGLGDWRRAHRAFLDTLFAQPARRAGLERWGVKEVRLGVEHALYLRWLYPKARFVFLYRNPYSAYRSYCRYGRNWYDVFPDRPVFTPGVFGRHWAALMRGFLDAPRELGCLLVRYEDLLADPAVLDRLERHLDVRVDRALLGGEKVGTSERAGAHASVSRLEHWLLARAVNPIAADLGYASS